MAIGKNNRRGVKESKKEIKQNKKELAEKQEKLNRIQKMKHQKKVQSAKVKADNENYINRRLNKIDERKNLKYLRDNSDLTDKEIDKLSPEELKKEVDNLYFKKGESVFNGIPLGKTLSTEDILNGEGLDDDYDEDSLKRDIDDLNKKQKKDKRNLAKRKAVKRLKDSTKRIIKWVVGIIISMGGLFTLLICIIAILLLSLGTLVITMIAFDVISGDLDKAGALGTKEVVKLTDEQKGDLTGMLGDYEEGKGVVMFPRESLESSGSKSSSSSSSSSTGGNLKGDNNPEKVWNFLRKAGYSEQATAGIMGNIQQESGDDFDSTLVNEIGAFGIAQWLDGRRETLNSRASAKGVDPSDLTVQLEMLDWEFSGGDTTCLAFLSENGSSPDDFKKLTDVNRATVLFDTCFERSGGSMLDKRVSNANSWYEMYKGK